VASRPATRIGHNRRVPATRPSVELRPATLADFDEVWPFFQRVLAAGGTYFYPAEIDRDELRAIWFGGSTAEHPARVHVAMLEGRVVGSFVVKQCHPGLGSHVANASFVVSPDAQAQGVGRTMGMAALEVARGDGYRAMQFNRVIRSNLPAVQLWQSLGFEIVGTAPEAYRHPQLGLVDALVMYRLL
jgi:L-amino acid N-acyltransferase YncA